MNETTKWFRKYFSKINKERANRIKNAGKHKCVKESIGSASRVTTSNGRILKRPVVLNRFYWCKICHKDMQ